MAPERDNLAVENLLPFAFAYFVAAFTRRVASLSAEILDQEPMPMGRTRPLGFASERRIFRMESTGAKLPAQIMIPSRRKEETETHSTVGYVYTIYTAPS